MTCDVCFQQPVQKQPVRPLGFSGLSAPARATDQLATKQNNGQLACFFFFFLPELREAAATRVSLVGD